MPDAYVIEVFGRTAGIVARDSQSNSFNFFSAAPRFNAIEGQRFSDPLAAERAARVLAQYGSFPRRCEAMSGSLGTNKCRLTSLIRLSHLAPEIVGALLAGRHPIELTPTRLLRLSKNLPHDWKEQRRFLGFAA